MRVPLLLASSLLLLSVVHVTSAPQPPAQGGGAQGGGVPPQGRGGNSFPAQQRALADAAIIARGKGLYESVCSACHGIDLRGGQQGGPNLLRSQTVLLDKAGELIGPVITGGRPTPAPPAIPMPPMPLPADDIKAIAEYIHSVLAMGGRQGRPPVDEIVPPEKVLVGDPSAGQAYFQSTCSSCHSITGDLKGIASRAADPRELQNMWVSGGGRGRGGAAGRATVKVTPASGAAVEGRLARIDDFTVSVLTADGTRRTFLRNGTDPRIEISDPAEAHRKLVIALADKDMHNVTAYLWTIK